MRDHPILTLMALVSAILIVLGRLNRRTRWGIWVFVAGIAMLVLAGLLYLVAQRR